MRNFEYLRKFFYAFILTQYDTVNNLLGRDNHEQFSRIQEY